MIIKTLNFSDPKNQKKHPDLKFKSNKLHIYDARPYLNAFAQRVSVFMRNKPVGGRIWIRKHKCL